jgi:hypothetical protein
MGAEVNTDDTGLPKNATDVQIAERYRQLKDKAFYDHGHSGYSGSMAESDGCSVRRDLEFDDKQSILKHIDDFAEKWGPAVAVFCKKTNSWVFAGIYSS